MYFSSFAFWKFTELRAEIDQLHQMHTSNSPEDNKNALAEIQLLREKLMESQQLLVESTRLEERNFTIRLFFVFHSFLLHFSS